MGNLSSPVVRAGSLLCFRLFEVGDAIDLDEAERQLKLAAVRNTMLERSPRGSMDFVAVPLKVDLGEREIVLPEEKKRLRVNASLHLFHYGIASVVYELPVAEGTALEQLTGTCREVYESASLTAAAKRELDEALPKLGPAIEDPHRWDGHETYTIVLVRELEGGAGASEVLGWPGLAKLLVGETSPVPLGDRHRDEVLEHASSYLASDLVVIDWNSALVLEPSESTAIVDILEFANTQLVSLRYYDYVLDQDVSRIHEELAEVGKKKRPLAVRSYTKLAHQLFRRLVDITEVSERVENAIKVTGNFYTARLYRASINRLRLSVWEQSIERKQQAVSEAYSMLKDEAELRLSMALEITVVILIVIEVVLAFMGH